MGMKTAFFGYSKKEVDSTMEALSSQNESLSHQNDYLEEELRILQKKLEETQALVADGMTQVDMDNYTNLKIAYAALQENVKDLEKEKTTLNDQHNAAAEGMISSAAGLEKSQAELNETRAQLNAVKAEAEAAKEALKSQQADANGQLNAALADAENVREQLNAAKAEAEAAQKALQTQQEAANAQLQAAQTENAQLQTALSAAVSNAENAHAEAEKANVELQAAKEEAADANTQLQNIKAQAEALRTQLEGVQAELDRRSQIDMSQYNFIVQSACKAVSESKEEARMKMLQNVNEFSDRWQESESRLNAIAEKMAELNRRTMEECERNSRALLENLNYNDVCLHEILKDAQEIQTERNRMASDLEKTVNAMKADPIKDQLSDADMAGNQRDKKWNVLHIM